MKTGKHPSLPIRHRLHLLVFFWGIFLLPITSLRAATYYVDTKGSDAAAGAIDQPFASLKKGHDKAAAGDTVCLRFMYESRPKDKGNVFR